MSITTPIPSKTDEGIPSIARLHFRHRFGYVAFFVKADPHAVPDFVFERDEKAHTLTVVNTQLPLNLRLRDGSSFDNFLATRNHEPIDRLVAAANASSGVLPVGERMLTLWGEAGSGKTHLLQSACRLIQERGEAPAYIPLAEAENFTPAILEDLEQAPLVCLDDIQKIAGERSWESALFSLYERMRSAGGALMVAGSAPPNRLGLSLPDLATRLGWGLVFHLLPLSDEDKLTALRLRAHNRGIEMPEDAARYLLHRHPRDMRSLFDLLDRIDRASLVQQRRITIPFLRGLEK